MILELRVMEDKDLHLTYAWRNDDAVRNMSMTSHLVSFNEHEAMYRYNTARRYVFQFEGMPCGYISITQDDETTSGMWGFHLAPEARGKKLSEIMLRMMVLEAKALGYTIITSEVMKTNLISLKLHEKLGFKKIGENEHFVELELPL